MSWYRMVDVRIHGDAKFLSLSPEQPSGRALFKHLLICEENGPLPGVVRAGAASLAEALEWSPEGLRERFGELFREGLAEADWKARLVFLPNGIKYNPPNNPNVVAGWAKHWDALPEGPLKGRIWRRFHAYFLEDTERRKAEIARGERDKKSDPEMLLKAFLLAMPEPEANGFRTVPGTVTLTVPERVGARSAGARALLPEPEQNSGTEFRRQEHTRHTPYPPPDHACGGEHAHEEQAPRQEDGGSAPEPPVARALRGEKGQGSLELEGGDAHVDVPVRPEATPPPRSAGNGSGGAHRKPVDQPLPPPGSLPGEGELAQLAEDLWRAHPTGLRGGSVLPVQRALLDLLKRGRIRPDGPAPPGPNGYALSFSELRERHAAWCGPWSRGETKPQSLARRWLGELEFLDEPPESKRAPPNKAKEWNPGVTPERLARAQAKLARRLEGATNEGGNGT